MSTSLTGQGLCQQKRPSIHLCILVPTQSLYVEDGQEKFANS